jgi:site-specific DNA recombinase
LSFAQFEREIISERTRDKMGAARKKGKWIGGTIPLGYDLDRETHKLSVNDKEAKIIREIFELYLKEKSTRRVLEIVNQQQYKTKHFFSRTGKEVGGKEFNLSSIQLLLKSVLYTGKVKYRGEIFKGMHDPIIGDELFARAQEINDENRVICTNPRTQKKRGLLAGLMRCKICDRAMIYTYTQKDKNKRYGYYVCNSAQKRGFNLCPTKSFNADEVEVAVIDCIAKVAGNPEEQRKNLEELQEKLHEEANCLDKELAVVIPKILGMKAKIKEIAESPDKDAREKERKECQDRLEDCERRESELRVSKIQTEEKMITQDELKNAMVVNSPVWETLFSEEKRRILSLMLESVDYDSQQKILGLNFNAKGIKLLSAEMQTIVKEAGQ